MSFKAVRVMLRVREVIYVCWSTSSFRYGSPKFKKSYSYTCLVFGLVGKYSVLYITRQECFFQYLLHIYTTILLDTHLNQFCKI